ARGYRVPEVNYAIGRAYGGLYKLRYEEVERSSDVEYRQRERRKLEAEFLTPAREHLRQAGGMRLEAPEYVEGLLPLYSQQYLEAVQRAEATLHHHPWQYEAHVLAGDAWAALGKSSLEHGRYEEARKNFDQAVTHYDGATDLARSDGSIYESQANALAKVIE